MGSGVPSGLQNQHGELTASQVGSIPTLSRQKKGCRTCDSPFLSFKFVVFSLQQMVKNSSQLLQTAPYYKLCVISQLVVHRFLICFFRPAAVRQTAGTGKRYASGYAYCMGYGRQYGPG
jgi:hypothetical protein